MENLKFKLGDRVAYTGGYIGEKETGTIVGIDTRDTCVPYALCLDNGRGYRIIGQYKITTKWLESFNEENINTPLVWALESDIELLKEDESIKGQFDIVRDRKKAELEEIDKQLEEYEKVVKELKDKRESIKRDYYL